MDHSSMDMSSTNSSSTSTSTQAACKISMLWNWYTVDSCFIARSWHVRSTGMFVGSCISVFSLVVALEFLHRSQREYDGYIVRSWQKPIVATAEASKVAEPEGALGFKKGWITPLSFRPTLAQQVVRSGIYMLQFGLAYFVMLLAMYYNGYIIICILLGVFAGHFLFGYDNIAIGGKQETGASCC